jgi:hypothetical protein
MSSNVTAPDGMSRSDVLKGLWRCSHSSPWFETIEGGVGELKKIEDVAFASNKEIERIFQKDLYVDYFGGRCIKTNMSRYPELDLTSFKNECKIPMSYAEIFAKCLNYKNYASAAPYNATSFKS